MKTGVDVLEQSLRTAHGWLNSVALVANALPERHGRRTRRRLPP